MQSATVQSGHLYDLHSAPRKSSVGRHYQMKLDVLHLAVSIFPACQYIRLHTCQHEVLIQLLSIFTKTNTLPFDECAFEHAAYLLENAEFESDRTLRSLVQLQRIVEDARDIYRTENHAGARSRLVLHSKRLLADLENWKHSMPEAYRNTGEHRTFRPLRSLVQLLLIFKTLEFCECRFLGR